MATLRWMNNNECDNYHDWGLMWFDDIFKMDDEKILNLTRFSCLYIVISHFYYYFFFQLSENVYISSQTSTSS